MPARISVIVPCYNNADALPRCLDSLLAQTYPDLEIIIVDDGSIDLTFETAKRYEGEHPNVKAVKITNRGPLQARLAGIAHSSGALVGFVDSDDWVEPAMYQRLFEALQKYQADIACCGVFEDEYGADAPPHKRRANPQKLSDGTVLTGKQAVAWMHRRQDVYAYMCNKLYKTALFHQVQFPEGTFIGEDYTANGLVFPRAKSVVTVRDVLYHYVQSPNSICRSGYTQAHAKAYQNYKITEKKLEKQFPEEKRTLRSYVMTEYLAILVAMSRNGNIDRQIQCEIVSFVRENLWGYLATPCVGLKYKLSAMAAAVHPGALGMAYALVGRPPKDENK